VLLALKLHNLVHIMYGRRIMILVLAIVCLEIKVRGKAIQVANPMPITLFCKLQASRGSLPFLSTSFLSIAGKDVDQNRRTGKILLNFVLDSCRKFPSY